MKRILLAILLWSVTTSVVASTPATVVAQVDAKQVTKQIATLAQQGKVLNCPFAANESITIDEIATKWGKADEQGQWIAAAKGYYVTYGKRAVAFGTNKGGAIFEVRSFAKDLAKVTLTDVKQKWGKPAYTATTKTEQIIGYVASKDYKLLFVFPKETKAKLNPMLHHYSILYPAGTVNNMAEDKGREW